MVVVLSRVEVVVEALGVVVRRLLHNVEVHSVSQVEAQQWLVCLIGIKMFCLGNGRRRVVHCAFALLAPLLVLCNHLLMTPQSYMFSMGIIPLRLVSFPGCLFSNRTDWKNGLVHTACFLGRMCITLPRIWIIVYFSKLNRILICTRSA